MRIRPSLNVVFLLLFCGGLVLRKWGVSGGSLLLTAGGCLLIVSLLGSGARAWTSSSGKPFYAAPLRDLFLGAALFCILFRLQYWLYQTAFTGLGFIFLLLSTALLLRSLHKEKSLSVSPDKWILSLLLWFLYLSSFVLNPRQFHSLYRSTTYEEYLRNAYPESETDLVDSLLEKYRSTDPKAIEDSRKFFTRGREAENENRLEEALSCYNR